MKLLPDDRDLLVIEQEMIEDKISKLATRFYSSDGFESELDRAAFKQLLDAMESYRAAIINILARE